MARGGKINDKHDFKKKVRSKEGNSDDSDEDYVVSDEGREASDYYCSSLDGCASEESLDNLIEEDDEFKGVRNFNRSKAKNGICDRRKKGSTKSRKRGRIVYADEEENDDEEEEEKKEESGNLDEDEDEEYNVEEEDDDEEEEEKKEENEHVEEDEEDYNVEEDEEDYNVEEDEEEYNEEEEEEDIQVIANKTSQKRRRITRAEQLEEEEEEIQGKRNFSRSKVKNGVCGKQGNASKTSQKRRRITNAERLEEKEEEEEEEVESTRHEEEEDADEEWEGDEEDFECDDEDDEFTPDEEDCSDEEEEISGKMKISNGTKVGKKVFPKRAYVVSTRGQKRRSSKASKKPTKSKRSRKGRLRRKVKGDDEDEYMDNSPIIMTRNRKKQGRKRRRLLLSDSDCVASGSSDFEYTISEEEREQVREAKELCGSLRDNLRSSSILINNEEARVHEDLHQQQKPLGRKGKEKIEEPQGRKGKVKGEDLKSVVGKQVCGICLSEEGKRRIRGVLNCCTHYFCFACIMEWAKVESRCPLCKQRFKTISKPARSTGVDLREAVIQVPERDQVYQPSEEELRSYIDPYESVICSECHEGGDDGLMLLCDICDSPAHTYCVGLGQEVPEGNWYCDGCRPVALGWSSTSQIQEDDPRVAIQSLPVRPSAVRHVRESIDLNLISSPRTVFNQGAGHFSSSRFTGRNVEGTSPVYGGAPTLSERRWIHRHIQHMLTSTRTDGISTVSSTSDSYRSQIDQSRETATQHTRIQDVGTSYHTFFEEGLCNNISPLVPNVPLWSSSVGTPSVPGYEQVHQFSRSNIVTDDSSSAAVREEWNFDNAKEQLQSMVKSHLKSLSQNIDLGQSTSKDIARSSMHTILAACGLEHNKNEVCTVPPPSVCPHIELMAGGQSSSLIKGCCSSCFDSFVGDVVKRIFDTIISSQWLRLGL